MNNSNPNPPDQVLDEARKGLQDLMNRSGLSRETFINLLNIAPSPRPEPVPQSLDGALSPIVKTESPVEVFSPTSRASAFPTNHRARISVSSTSSASSGKASLWSTAGSTFSTSTTLSHQSTGGLPPTPCNKAPTGSASPSGAGGSAGWGAARLNFYWCTSCETRFKRKYDWKRHEEEFHERWKKYPCPEPGCNRSFWGANTFNQHHKSSHGCKTCPHSEKVVKYLRKRKFWACGFCAALHPSRERHVEHVARHFESGKTKADWQHSRVIYGLLHQPLIHEAWKDILAKQPDFGSRLPQFSWNPTSTGRQQGFMENECRGQLQDLLEFFSGNSVDAEALASMAWECCDKVFPQPINVASPSHGMDANANVLGYPTPPDTSLSPVTPGTTISSCHGQQQQPMAEPTSPTPQQFHGGFRASQHMMAPNMFNMPQTVPASVPQGISPGLHSVSSTLRRSSMERPLPPPPPSSSAELPIPMQPSQAPPPPPQAGPVMGMSYHMPTGSDQLMMDDCWSLQSYATTVVDDAIPAPSQLPNDWAAMMAFNFNQPPQ